VIVGVQTAPGDVWALSVAFEPRVTVAWRPVMVTVRLTLVVVSVGDGVSVATTVGASVAEGSVVGAMEAVAGGATVSLGRVVVD
jgi:hypothetical protein